MFNQAQGRGPLLDLVSEPEVARGLRRLRATGLTWMAVRGDDPLKIMQRAGHTSFQTTQPRKRSAWGSVSRSRRCRQRCLAQTSGPTVCKRRHG